MEEYGKNLERIGHILYELLSELSGLKKSYLHDMDVPRDFNQMYYLPLCPKPYLTLGSITHDIGFLTLILPNKIGRFQVLYDNKYVDIPPFPESLTINLGDMFKV